MSINRTRKQKQQSSLRHTEILSYSLGDLKPGQVSVSLKEKKQETEAQQLKQIFDPSFVKKDLFKTLIVTMLVVGVLIAYTIYQR